MKKIIAILLMPLILIPLNSQASAPGKTGDILKKSYVAILGIHEMADTFTAFEELCNERLTIEEHHTTMSDWQKSNHENLNVIKQIEEKYKKSMVAMQSKDAKREFINNDKKIKATVEQFTKMVTSQTLPEILEACTLWDESLSSENSADMKELNKRVQVVVGNKEKIDKVLDLIIANPLPSKTSD